MAGRGGRWRAHERRPKRMQARSEAVSAPFDFRSDAWLYDPAIQGVVEARLAAEFGADAVEVGGAVLSALFAPEADPTSVEEWAARVRAELLGRGCGGRGGSAVAGRDRL